MISKGSRKPKSSSIKFRREVLFAKHHFDNFQQSFRLERFNYPARGSGLTTGLLFFLRWFGGQHNDRRESMFALFTNLLDQFKAIHVGHIQVRDQLVDLGSGKLGQSIKTILCLHNLVAGVSQRQLHYLTNGFRIIYNQNTFCHHDSLMCDFYSCGTHWQCKKAEKIVQYPERIRQY